ncbi:beta strand repeat-containing protein [Leisingera sp. S232]|uniref:beta strand repeat-containing protein n=1 Tax=Leisingera sp. S232 TaxID=3415132 RepID=UPI003C7B702F
MAIFNGTPGSDQIAGTNDDDIITGLAGADDINGADGNDTIDGGADDDNILGGAGDDEITITTGEFTAAEVIDGGDDTDTLITDLAAGDDLSVAGAAGGAFNLGAVAALAVTSIERVQVSNAGDAVLSQTSGDNQFFIFDDDADIASADFTNATVTLEGNTFNGTSGAVTHDDVTFSQAAGIIIDGVTYEHDDSFETANGGTITVNWDGTDADWQLTYEAPTDIGTIALGDTFEDDTLTVTVEDTTGNTITRDIAVDIDFGVNINVNGGNATFTTDVRIEGTSAANTIQDGAGNDTIIGGDGADNIDLNDGDNRVWAGADDEGNDTVDANGDGNNIIAGGGGDDDLDINGNGNNEAWGGDGTDTIDIGTTLTADGAGDNTVGGGAGDDTITINGDGANTAWGGTGTDTIVIGTADGDAAGNNTTGGGDGLDDIDVNGDGDNIIYAGNDDDADTIDILATATGNNTIFGGGTSAGGAAGSDNQINIAGSGNNIVYNGGGNDDVDVLATATGDNVLYGGAGDDVFNFASADASATIIFETGNGADVIEGFIAGDADHKVDLSALGFADADDVLDSMTDDGTDVTLFITAGQTITFDSVDLSALQAADPADWLIL